ncbi:MFS transporter [Paractinoplanes globisporus]|uniref:MFS transporter n=1 Tax=Paractinoplanes globisporus TaxID=113565 RepID=UPI001FDEC646|nr:MFS transporter [Actinoplanes globisporus]
MERPATLDRTKATKIAANVLALGTVSLVTDVSSEMVSAILPLYLVVGLGLGPAVYGLVDGLYTGATALLRLAGGYIADKVQRRKLVAGLGYGISAVAKAGLLLAGGSPAGIGAAIVADRAGKGLRTAPRDAMITLSMPEEGLGRAFGVHRAMDSAGAFAGPLVAIGVLAASGQAFDAVFVVSGCVAAIGVLVLVLFVRDRPVRVPGKVVNLRQAAKLLERGKVRLLLFGAILLGLSAIGDGFVYLLLQRREDIAIGWFPLLAVGTSLVYLIMAVPLGALADRAGRTRVFLGGYAALLAVYLILATSWSGWGALVTVLLLYGVFYAATDGVLMAVAGPLLPPELRTTGLALIQTGQAVAYLVSSVLFGLAWQWWGAAGATRAAVAAATLTLAGSAVMFLRTRQTPAQAAA